VDPPFPEYDHVHQVAPRYYEDALLAGEPEERHSVVPYGIKMPQMCPALFGDVAAKISAKQILGIPAGRSVVLSVGNVSAFHKRMDYVIEEVARIAESERPFLVLLGQQDSSTALIRQLADRRLGSGYRIETCKPEEISVFYQAADIFVLASLKEGFGRVFLEALAHGLPVVAHDGPVMQYVVGEEGLFVDMTKAGALAGMFGA